MTIAFTTPAQINMWVLLSRRSQIKLHLKGYPVAGLLKWCKANIEGCENARTVKQCVVPLEYVIASANGPQDFSIVNVHVMLGRGGMFFDRGIFNDMSEVEADANLVRLYNDGLLEIVYTLEDAREANDEVFVPE